MCGITGQYAFGGGEPDEDLVRRMSSLLAHRGPDGEGFLRRGSVALAHRRLSIIDLSDQAGQPMKNEDGTLAIVFNGEIYNYRELREELTASGHNFRSESDTEVIIHAFEEWGCECLQRFNGMWAFALHNATTGELFCARDRFGIKPFYYANTGESLFFASEIKALLEHDGIGREPNDRMVMTFLAWGVMDHTPETMFKGVFQIPPGHFMLVRPGACLPPEAYWHLHMEPAPVSSPGADSATVARCRDLLLDAVRIRLRSDVPVGTCLSGGIDSTTITSVINGLIRTESPESVGERQNTFSARYAGAACDEGIFMDCVVAETGVSPHWTQPDPEHLLPSIERMLYHQDEPFGSLSIYAQYAVMELAGRSVRVVLDGQGADEQLGGYLAYLVPYIRSLKRHPLRAVGEGGWALYRHWRFLLAAWRQLRIRSGRRSLLSGEYPAIDRYAGPLDQVLAAEIASTNLPALLHYEDRNSMAFSVEARVPFLDWRLVEFFASLPLDQKIRHGVTKYILRKAVRGVIPEKVRCRMDKIGFATPEDEWMRRELREFIGSVLSSSSFGSRPYWNPEAVRRGFEEYAAGRMPYSFEIWRIVCTELWLRMFFDNRGNAAGRVR
ncbi:MAG: asparagine synthase (glutamine-hydrolyzing) [Methanomicrobiales archaeon]|nr:asparagine synthase (glutamine-hydrolyzing) [Methanomicrobiales archaeon]